MYPHTRKHDRLHNLAAYYVSEGFDNIPIDEVMIYNDLEQSQLRSWINELRNYEDMIIKLRGRPWGTGTRESVITPGLVGADFREERDKFLATNDLIAQAHGASGGRKSKKRKSKKRKSKKRKSKKRKSKKRKSRK